MNDNDTLVIRSLKDSYRRQLLYYKALGDIGRKIMTRLVLSRGDFGLIKGEVAEKQRLLGCIEGERAKTAPQLRCWRECKQRMESDADAREFDEILMEIETIIRDFLDGEDQLKKYIEGIISKYAS